MDRGLVEHFAEPDMYRCYKAFCSSSESNKYMENRLRVQLYPFQRKWGPIYGCPAPLMKKKKWKIVSRVPRKRVKSKFLYQDADVIPLADKYVYLVVRALSAGTMTEFTWRRTSSLTTSELQNMDSCLGLTVFESSNTTFQNIGHRLNPPLWKCRLRHSLSWSTVLHTPYTRPWWFFKFWCHENETGSLYFGPLRKIFLSFWLRTMLKSPVTTWQFCLIFNLAYP